MNSLMTLYFGFLLFLMLGGVLMFIYESLLLLFGNSFLLKLYPLTKDAEDQLQTNMLRRNFWKAHKHPYIAIQFFYSLWTVACLFTPSQNMALILLLLGSLLKPGALRIFPQYEYRIRQTDAALSMILIALITFNISQMQDWGTFFLNLYN